jgi:hypothetical protein
MNQKKHQEEERLRREALRRRMRSDLTMDDILGPHRAAANPPCAQVKISVNML